MPPVGRKRKGKHTRPDFVYCRKSFVTFISLFSVADTQAANDAKVAATEAAAAPAHEEIEDPEIQSLEYINLTTHTGHFGSNPIKLNWGAPTAEERGPVIATVSLPLLFPNFPLFVFFSGQTWWTT
jgi:hypothetical protein